MISSYKIRDGKRGKRLCGVRCHRRGRDAGGVEAILGGEALGCHGRHARIQETRKKRPTRSGWIRGAGEPILLSSSNGSPIFEKGQAFGRHERNSGICKDQVSSSLRPTASGEHVRSPLRALRGLYAPYGGELAQGHLRRETVQVARVAAKLAGRINGRDRRRVDEHVPSRAELCGSGRNAQRRPGQRRGRVRAVHG